LYFFSLIDFYAHFPLGQELVNIRIISVYGFHWAFKMAGAKYLIMSLWQVPDRTTSILMTLFYKKWVEDKMSIPEAFQ
jgi:CHAT domain-containing protein